jgi:3-oxoacyl-(acyl-carrier-protein) synthase
MEEALEDGGLKPEQVGYVMAHASGTKMNDSVESQSLTQVFGGKDQGPPVTSAKPCTGHTLGVSGGLEVVNGVSAWEHRELPPVPNLCSLDPECEGVNVVREARELTNPVFLVNSFGFGGTNCCALLRAGEAED